MNELIAALEDALLYAEEVMLILDRADRLPLKGPRYDRWRAAIDNAR